MKSLVRLLVVCEHRNHRESEVSTVKKSQAMVVIGVVAVASSCSGADIAEKVAENRIEAEGGEDVDIDFNDDGVSVKTPDGEFTIQADDDGNFSIEADGEADGESFSIDSENGETVIETEDGTSVITQSADLPDDFPSQIPVPDGIVIQFAQTSETGQGTGYVFAATSDRPMDDLLDEVASGLEENGFERQQLTETPTGSMLVYQGSNYNVVATFTAGDGEPSGFQMTVVPESG